MAEVINYTRAMPSVSYMLVIQAAVTLVLACLLWFVWGFLPALSALYGGLCWFIPTVCMAFGLGLMGGKLALTAEGALLRFLVWELVKLAFAVVLLLLAQVVLPQVHWLALLAGLLLAAKAQWLAWLIKRPVRPAKQASC